MNNLGNFDFLDEDLFSQEVKAIRKVSRTFHAPASRRSYHINDDFGEQQMKQILDSSEDESKKDPHVASATDKADLKNITQDWKPEYLFEYYQWNQFKSNKSVYKSNWIKIN